jgi:phosphopantothenoylcysteine decarboxylase/phosphopantothenate--cysteine ligase
VRILITAGPTREYLDDVRYLSNASTGRMGYALAAAAKAAGHSVTLVHGPTSHDMPPVDKVIAVTSAQEMFAAVAAEFPACDALIACAAVSDYRPKRRSTGKIKRESAATLTLELVQNPDIVREMAAQKRAGQVVIGFALESSAGEAAAREKMVRKGLDAIVLNALSAIGATETEITIFRVGRPRGETVRGSKDEAARRIVALAEELADSSTATRQKS